MQHIHTRFILLLLLGVSTLTAQNTRYVDPIFDAIQVTRDVTYGTNVTIITSPPSPQELLMDVYEPADDDNTDRPVVVYFHTGSFLPQYRNGQITGSRTDSTVVEICTRLARRGYVAIAATYRQGWLPTSEDQNVRTSTLLQAAYRGIQDARTLIRFLRKDVAENGDTYGIDADRIVLWGQGTGGYISLGAAFLDNYEEEIVIDKFINSETLLPYIDTTLHGNLYGTNQTPINLPNHVGYSSDFALAVNMGGALGDSSWIDGTDDEPAVIGYHFLRDPFAPFANGPVIVPTTQQFVVNVSGTYVVVDKANDLGLNDAMQAANAPTLPGFPVLSTVVNQRNALYKQVPLNYQGQMITLSVDNMYPFVTAGVFASGWWDWWNKEQLDAVLAGTQFDANALHASGLITNPGMSPELARAYIDTVMAHFLPRACEGLQLAECAITSTEDLLDAKLVNLKLAPNPAADMVRITANAETPMRAIQLFDMNGRFIRSYSQVNSEQFDIPRGDLPPGAYLVKVVFERGVAVDRVIFR